MSVNGINADLSQMVAVHSQRMNWQASADGMIWCKPLDLVGAPENGRMTSLVRYDPGSSLAEHAHPGGEEILVVKGVLSDQHGDYPAGSFLLNPEGFSHAHSSRHGCVLFVKLRQYAGSGRQHVAVDTRRRVWQSDEDDAVGVIPLYRDQGYPEEIQLVRLRPKSVAPSHVHEGGAEVFVLEGSFSDENGSYEQGSWVRYPDGSIHRIRTQTGCTYYLKTGHLSGQDVGVAGGR
jgi:anti-sigma factor ChrR (cupin superfamily)